MALTVGTDAKVVAASNLVSAFMQTQAPGLAGADPAHVWEIVTRAYTAALHIVDAESVNPAIED